MFRDEGLNNRWLIVANIGSVAIPPFSVVELFTRGATNFINTSVMPWHGGTQYIGANVRRPASANLSNIGVNGETAIPVYGYGVVAVSGPCYVAHGTTVTTPGTLLGTTANSFTLSSGGFPGLVTLGDRSGLAGELELVDFVRASSGYKQLCRFTAGSAFTTASASVSATIQTQYGPGASHPSTAITAYNLLNGAESAYVFSGASGAAGLAMWDSGTSWRIIQMECP